MAVEITLHDINNAWKIKDESTVQLFLQLVVRNDSDEQDQRPQAYTFDKFIREIRSYDFSLLPDEEKASLRKEKLALLEGPNAEVPLSDKLTSHKFIMMLWQDNSSFSRQCLIDIVSKIPLCYGPWKGIKRIYKESELDNDIEIFGAIGARIDREYCRNTGAISRVTIAYLKRRSWRYLRNLAKSFPITYPDAAVNFLKHCDDETYFAYESVAEKIMVAGDDDWRDDYNTIELWRRTPRPLFTLLESARSEQVQKFAIRLLKSEFRTALRDTDPAWVMRLAGIGTAAVDEFIVWILQNTPRFEQSKFKQLGLHDAVLRLFFSSSNNAVKYAIEYARTNARDLSIDTLISLLAVDVSRLTKFALELIAEKDPRKEVGLEGFVKIISTGSAYDFVVESLQKHFSASELTPEWFKQLLLSENESRVSFAIEHLFDFHPRKNLELEYFNDIIFSLQKKDTWSSYYDGESYEVCIDYVLEQLTEFDLNLLDLRAKQRLFLWPPCSDYIPGWIEEGELSLTDIGLEFLRPFAYEPDWTETSLILELKKTDGIEVTQLNFNVRLAYSLRNCLSDPRQFKARDVGFYWLLRLVKDSDTDYHNFATKLLLKSFSPEDFAESAASSTTIAGKTDVVIDLEQAAFLFTGKLKTMTRKEAGEKVKQANGTILSAVTKNLDYLVIGDEGSPLYGEGSKGSKQLKAEDLIESGAKLKVVSEAGFLQMLVEGSKTADVDLQMAGCERLWGLLLSSDRKDAQLAKFALKYFRYHHVNIAKSIDDSIVDPGTEIPDEFITFERIFPLFVHKSKTLRDFALEFSRWEFARWSPSIDQIMAMLKLPHLEVRQFVTNALFADEKPEHRFYRINSSEFTEESVYQLCDSRIPEAYETGMMLVHRHDKHQVPGRLFHLTENQNRKVRAFAIKQLWILYRDKGLSLSWSPNSSNAEQLKNNEGSRQTVSRPENIPAEQLSLKGLLRKCLFEIPKGRITSNSRPDVAVPDKKGRSFKDRPVRLISTSKTKLALIETIRDIAVDDSQFAEYIFPLFEEFKQSIGQSEQAACLVASTRIKRAHPSLMDTKEITG